MNDPTLVCLARVIQFGWPESSAELPSDVKPFYQHRYELHIVDGVIFFHNRIVMTIGLKRQFLNKLHDSHMGIAKTKLMARTLVYWPRWNEDREKLCAECNICHENQNMPANVPKFQVKAMYPGHIYGNDVAHIGQTHGQHLVLVDYYSCAIFECKLKSLQSSDVIDALKDMFCDISTPDKLISDNAWYFISDEFSEFMMHWSICHITSSPRYPQGNTHAEKDVGIVKQLYDLCQDVKSGLLLLKTTPILNQKGDPAVKAPCHSLYGRQLKAHLPLYRSANFASSENTCTLATETEGADSANDILSKFSVNQDIWIKLDANTKKWESGKVLEILPNRSYTIELTDGHIFRRNEHHLTRRLGCIKCSTTSEADNTKTYNLRPRKLKKSVSWPDFPARNAGDPVDFELPDML